MAERQHGTPMHCCRCSYDWFPRGSELPKRCPECRSVKWNSPNLLVECLRCGHKWNSQKGSPKRCPSCGSKCWNVPPKKHVCIECGREWTSTSDARPGRCPFCGTKYWDAARQASKRMLKRSAVTENSALKNEIRRLHDLGETVVQIAIRTGAPCSVVIETLKAKAPEERARISQEARS